MKTIFVHFWGYKSKELPEAVNALISNQSGQNKVIVSVYDQVNVGRAEKFNSDMYEHVRWDRLSSPYELLDRSIASSDADFFMYVDGAVYFEQGWDIELTLGHGGRDVIISGSAGIQFEKEAKFYPAYKRFESSTATITNWVSHDFVFTTLEMFKSFPSLSRLKYLGLEDVLSLYAMHKNIPVQSIPSAWCRRLDKSLFEADYVPFSPKHNYSLVVDIYKGRNNLFFEDVGCVQNLQKAVGFNFDKINYLPYPHSDIGYDPEMKLDSMSAERFSHAIRSIE
jgi:hypothetical protein